MQFSLVSTVLLFAAAATASKESCEAVQTAQANLCGGLQSSFSCVCKLSSADYWDYYYNCVEEGGAGVSSLYLDSLKAQICAEYY